MLDGKMSLFKKALQTLRDGGAVTDFGCRVRTQQDPSWVKTAQDVHEDLDYIS